MATEAQCNILCQSSSSFPSLVCFVLAVILYCDIVLWKQQFWQVETRLHFNWHGGIQWWLRRGFFDAHEVVPSWKEILRPCPGKVHIHVQLLVAALSHILLGECRGSILCWLCHFLIFLAPWMCTQGYKLVRRSRMCRTWRKHFLLWACDIDLASAFLHWYVVKWNSQISLDIKSLVIL